MQYIPRSQDSTCAMRDGAYVLKKRSRRGWGGEMEEGVGELRRRGARRWRGEGQDGTMTGEKGREYREAQRVEEVGHDLLARALLCVNLGARTSIARPRTHTFPGTPRLEGPLPRERARRRSLPSHLPLPPISASTHLQLTPTRRLLAPPTPLKRALLPPPPSLLSLPRPPPRASAFTRGFNRAFRRCAL